MRLKLMDVIASVVGCLMLVGMTGCSQTGARAESETVSKADASIERVTAAKPKRKTLRVETTQPAWIEAFERTPLYAKVAGYVQQVHVDIGDPIKQGQTLVTLSVPELGDEVAQKEALVAQAEAEVKQAECSVAAAQASTQSATARIAEAQADVGRTVGEYERSSAEYDRIKKLAGNGSVSEKLVDEARNQQQAAAAGRDAAEAAVQSAEAVAREMEAKARKAEADRVAAVARQGVARADLAHAKTMFAYGEIKSPFDGVVTERAVDTGHFVQPAAGGAGKPLLVVARQDKVRVFLDVPELESALVDVGDPATLRVQALGGRELHAAVTRTSWSINNSNRSLRTEVDLPNDGSKLRPGMYATATILLDKRDHALVLPMTAIGEDGGQAYCWCVESGKAVRHNLTLGLRSGAEVEVLKGVNEDSMVVLSRGESLQPGESVVALAPKE
jgi:HlyD family secretion protein